MHTILERQLRRYIQNKEVPTTVELEKLFNAISETYDHYDQDYRLLERSLEISSKELGENNEKLQKEIERVQNSKAENKELEQMNKFMIGRELRMIELKEQVNELEEQLARTTHPIHASSNWTNKDALSDYGKTLKNA